MNPLCCSTCIFGLRLSLSPPTVRLPRCCCVRRLDIPIQAAKNLLLPRAPCPRSCRSQGCRIKSVQTRILNPPKTQLLAVWISRGSSDASPLFLGSTRLDLRFASWCFDGEKKRAGKPAMLECSSDHQKSFRVTFLGLWCCSGAAPGFARQGPKQENLQYTSTVSHGGREVGN